MNKVSKEIWQRLRMFWEAIGYAMKAIVIGVGAPKYIHGKSHSVYAVQSDELILEANEYACNVMMNSGWTLKSYELREHSCMVFAMHKLSLMNKYLAEHTETDLAQPLALFGYTPDGSDYGHICVRAIGSKTFYFEPYGEEKYRNRTTLSKKEIQSKHMLVRT